MPAGRGVLSGKPQHVAGRRDCYVTIEGTTTPSGGQFPTEEWTTVERIWMSRTELQADERFAADQESGFVVTQWQAPYVASLDPDLVNVVHLRRLRYGHRVFNIRSASEIGRKDGIELLTLAQGVGSVQ